MVYTEIQSRNSKRYYYRVLSIRKGKKVSKKRKYLGINLPLKSLIEKEIFADKEFKLKNKEIDKKAIEKIKPKIIRILKRNKIKKAGIFGSYAKGMQKKNSDVDILIEPAKGMGLEFVGVKLELEEALKKKVDLVTYNGIHPLIKREILKEEIRII